MPVGKTDYYILYHEVLVTGFNQIFIAIVKEKVC